MRRLCPFLLFGLLMCSCNSQRVGHGYRIHHRTVDMHNVSGAFEGLAHYNDLHHGSRRFGTVGEWSISPSGRFALFEDNGRLLLFDRDLGQKQDVTDGSFAVPKNVAWNESAGIAEVIYYEDERHAPSKIELRK